MLRNRFLAEDEEASAESAEAAESVETEEESVEAPSEDGDNKKSRKKSSSSAPEERECEIGEYMRQSQQRWYLMPPTTVMSHCAVA